VELKLAYIRIPEKAWLVMKGSEIMYYTDLWWTRALNDKYAEIVVAEPVEAFYQFVADQINTVLEGKLIPEEIEPAILNMIDDKKSGRKMGIRTGDYISLQKFYQERVKK